MDELVAKLNNVPDAYFEFVDTIISYSKKKESRLSEMLEFMSDNPTATSSDILYFMCTRPDFKEDVVKPKKEAI